MLSWSLGASDAPLISKRVLDLHGRLSGDDRVGDGTYLQDGARADRRSDAASASTRMTATDIPTRLPPSDFIYKAVHPSATIGWRLRAAARVAR